MRRGEAGRGGQLIPPHSSHRGAVPLNPPDPPSVPPSTAPLCRAKNEISAAASHELPGCYVPSVRAAPGVLRGSLQPLSPGTCGLQGGRGVGGRMAVWGLTKRKREKEKGRGRGGGEAPAACDGERSRAASHLGAGLGAVRTPAGRPGSGSAT